MTIRLEWMICDFHVDSHRITSRLEFRSDDRSFRVNDLWLSCGFTSNNDSVMLFVLITICLEWIICDLHVDKNNVFGPFSVDFGGKLWSFPRYPEPEPLMAHYQLLWILWSPGTKTNRTILYDDISFRANILVLGTKFSFLIIIWWLFV